ncbi:MAG: phospholipid/cholesterol/gamma-HCH transport system substrate-binding protein [Streptosporangiaceae bacterium]|jgi:phospholipid/cholesterol/gamma-HCH transport system substrate-binding protein|nr:phospholipid/cholesterol/gamma-HCH transport system substrate-binding protein [Streptosporangiaceae bacterium]
MRRLRVLAIVLLLTVTGCSYQTAGSPKGGEVLTADFDDVQNLAVGHSVQIADVRVGTVTRMKLAGSGSAYRANVTFSLRRGIRIPQGTTAQLGVTSLLGENFIQLSPPSSGLHVGPFIADHGHISATSVVPAFEQVVGKAAPLLTALAHNDIQAIVSAGSTAFAGKGPELQKMIAQASKLTALFAGQRAQLAGAVDDLARLGHDLAKGQAQLDDLPGTLARTTKVLSDDRYQMLNTLDQISKLTQTTDANLLVGRTDQLRTLIERMGPVIGTLASDKTNLGGLITSLQNYVSKVPRSIYNGQLLLYTVEAVSFGSPGRSAPTTANALTQINAAMGGRS